MKTQRGSASIVTLAAGFALLAGALAVADAGSFLYARAQAQAAADAAALAAVVEQIEVISHGEDPVEAAGDAAARNGATLIDCACERGSATATVTVEIEPRIAFLPAWSGRRVRATAVAEAEPWLSSYRT